MTNVRWIGEVPHERIGTYYEAADILLFPTLCDGFGLVQIEAQAHALPVIASRFCGEVVTNGENGLLLDNADAAQITAALRWILAHPGELERFSRNSAVARFGIADLGHAMRAVFDQDRPMQAGESKR
jgi:glycosyltransferase involved in cell wall biosynthesis